MPKRPAAAFLILQRSRYGSHRVRKFVSSRASIRAGVPRCVCLDPCRPAFLDACLDPSLRGRIEERGDALSGA